MQHSTPPLSSIKHVYYIVHYPPPPHPPIKLGRPQKTRPRWGGRVGGGGGGGGGGGRYNTGGGRGGTVHKHLCELSIGGAAVQYTRLRQVTIIHIFKETKT